MKMRMEGDYEQNLGQQIKKNSGKPFKSGQKIGTVKDVEVHDLPTGIPAKWYRLEEDDSLVECWRCSAV